MGCTTCKQSATTLMPCRVCELVDRDLSIKKVIYCSFCEAYICIPCSTDIVKRTKAAIKDLRLKL